jgi:hypothetical protein
MIAHGYVLINEGNIWIYSTQYKPSVSVYGKSKNSYLSYHAPKVRGIPVSLFSEISFSLFYSTKWNSSKLKRNVWCYFYYIYEENAKRILFWEHPWAFVNPRRAVTCVRRLTCIIEVPTLNLSWRNSDHFGVLCLFFHSAEFTTIA